MTVYLFFAIATVLMICGHIVKVKRWELYISVYEKPIFSNLLQALALGHTINTLVPTRIGDIARFTYAGRKLKNGYSLSLATVLTDLYVDFITVGLMFVGLAQIGKGGESLPPVMRMYVILMLVIIPVSALCFIFRKYVKRLLHVLSSIFSEPIEFRILYVTYLTIASLRDIVTKISKVKFIIYTVGMWVSYVLSYVIFAEAIQEYGFNYSTSEVFTMLFSGNAIGKIDVGAVSFLLFYLLLPLFICFLISFMIRPKESVAVTYHNTLPQMNKNDRLAFLRTYYQEENREFIQAYLEINKDVQILDDNSAGSNASTVTILKDGKMYYRKYAFNKDGRKLAAQVDWILQNANKVPLTKISDKQAKDAYVYYDMPRFGNATEMFRYIHTESVENSWNILNNVLNDVKNNLHGEYKKTASKEIIKKYIEEKVTKNLTLILNNRLIKNIERNEKIEINKIKYPTLHNYSNMFSKKTLLEILKEDPITPIHGDLTIENIICTENEYYLIDPNTGNILDSPFIDYAKLLQSLHGEYEYLMTVGEISVTGGSISYKTANIGAYSKLYEKYRKWLGENLSKDQIKSIYAHEIINFIRLLPYKIKKDERIAPVFYGKLLQLLSEFEEMYER